MDRSIIARWMGDSWGQLVLWTEIIKWTPPHARANTHAETHLSEVQLEYGCDDMRRGGGQIYQIWVGFKGLENKGKPHALRRTVITESSACGWDDERTVSISLKPFQLNFIKPYLYECDFQCEFAYKTRHILPRAHTLLRSIAWIGKKIITYFLKMPPVRFDVDLRGCVTRPSTHPGWPATGVRDTSHRKSEVEPDCINTRALPLSKATPRTKAPVPDRVFPPLTWPPKRGICPVNKQQNQDET